MRCIKIVKLKIILRNLVFNLGMIDQEIAARPKEYNRWFIVIKKSKPSPVLSHTIQLIAYASDAMP